MPGYETSITTTCVSLTADVLSAEQLTQVQSLSLSPSDGSCIADAVDYYSITVYDSDGSSTVYSTDGCESSGNTYVLDVALVTAVSTDGSTNCSA